jgi:SAM-dependent methyltransferase
MDELDRIRVEYARRARDPRLRDRYSLFRPGALFMLQTREQAALRLLRRAGFEPLDRLDILEMGCGEGGVLLDLIRWGCNPARLNGCDLIYGHLAQARRRLPPSVTLAACDGGALAYPAARFDLVLQFTVFTSVLDAGLRQRMAQELWRVLRPGGAVLWYDFRFRGRNSAVRPVHPREVRAFFPRGQVVARRVTLAPPIARRLAPWTWLGCGLLSSIPWLCTHDLILIRKTEETHA